MSTVVHDPDVDLRHARCDACGFSDNKGVARATVRVRFRLGELDFCGSHFAQYEPHLRAQAVDIIDQRPY